MLPYDDEYKAGYWHGAAEAKDGFKAFPQPSWSSAYRDGYSDGYYETRAEIVYNLMEDCYNGL